jgi:uncharacterized protein (DUF39 family)
MPMTKTVQEINRKISQGNAVVLTGEEMAEFAKEKGISKAAEEIDVVTTGTFGSMCSSGAFLNFGHSDPPIKMERVWLNGVEAYHGGAAVDCYIGATKMDPARPFEYGGGHVIEDLVAGREVSLRAEAYGTDCYPRKEVECAVTIGDLNQAIMVNPRNAYQTYVAATNSTEKTIYTYMGELLPSFGNVNYAGTGVLSPLNKDPTYRTIGIGTRIFLGGGVGYIIGEGTQHSPSTAFGNIMVRGDLKEMSTEYVRGTRLRGYGTSLAIGLGIPIPVINEEIAKTTARTDADVKINLLDYGVPKRTRPTISSVTYQELRSGKVKINGKDVETSPLTSIKKARQVASELKDWIKKGKFALSEPCERLSTSRVCKPMKEGKQ